MELVAWSFIMSKILVTGASGFVGRSLVSALISEGHYVRCAVSNKTDKLPAEQVIVDRLELKPDWSRALKEIDIVIHLAARVHIMQKQSQTSLDEYFKVNSIATKELAEEAAAHGIKRFVFLSSIKVNGEYTLENAPFTESSVTNPDDPYGQSKLYAEQYLKIISKNTDMEVVILRPPLVYGPGVKANFLKMIKLVNKSWLLPFGKVTNKRSFIYIDNLISALCTVAVNPKAGNQVYLVSDNESWSLTELLNTLANQMNVKLRTISIPNQLLSGIFKLCGLNSLTQRLLGSLEVSNNKIKEELGWNPPVRSIDGLKDTVKWYQNDIS